MAAKKSAAKRTTAKKSAAKRATAKKSVVRHKPAKAGGLTLVAKKRAAAVEANLGGSQSLHAFLSGAGWD
jgi:hypothetical protein